MAAWPEGAPEVSGGYGGGLVWVAVLEMLLLAGGFPSSLEATGVPSPALQSATAVVSLLANAVTLFNPLWLAKACAARSGDSGEERGHVHCPSQNAPLLHALNCTRKTTYRDIQWCHITKTKDTVKVLSVIQILQKAPFLIRV